MSTFYGEIFKWLILSRCLPVEYDEHRGRPLSAQAWDNPRTEWAERACRSGLLIQRSPDSFRINEPRGPSRLQLLRRNRVAAGASFHQNKKFGSDHNMLQNRSSLKREQQARSRDLSFEGLYSIPEIFAAMGID